MTPTHTIQLQVGCDTAQNIVKLRQSLGLATSELFIVALAILDAVNSSETITKEDLLKTLEARKDKS